MSPYRLNARAYDPMLGRFLQTDPIRYSAGANLYVYAGGDPENLTDPTGFDPFLGFRSATFGIDVGIDHGFVIGGVSTPGKDNPTFQFSFGPERPFDLLSNWNTGRLVAEPTGSTNVWVTDHNFATGVNINGIIWTPIHASDSDAYAAGLIVSNSLAKGDFNYSAVTGVNSNSAAIATAQLAEWISGRDSTTTIPSGVFWAPNSGNYAAVLSGSGVIYNAGGNIGSITYSFTDVAKGDSGTVTVVSASSSVVVTGSRIPVNVNVVIERSGGGASCAMDPKCTSAASAQNTHHK